MSMEEKMTAIASKSAELLREIEETEHSRPALAEADKTIASLSKELPQQKAEVQRLSAKQSQERAEWLDVKDSVGRRWAHKLSGKKEKYTSNVEKEEREFLDALQEYRNAQNQVEVTTRQLEDAKAQKQKYEAVAERNKQLQDELDELHKPIFAGTTKGFEEEDKQEEIVRQARDAWKDAQAALSHEERVEETIQDAEKELTGAKQALGTAHDASTADMWGFDFAAVDKGSGIAGAQNHIQRAQTLMERAAKLSEKVQLSQPIHIERMHAGDVVFDNIFSDMAAHDSILQSERTVEQELSRVREVLKAAAERVKELRAAEQEAFSRFCDNRRQLQNIRQDAIAQASSQPPPKHTE